MNTSTQDILAYVIIIILAAVSLFLHFKVKNLSKKKATKEAKAAKMEISTISEKKKPVKERKSFSISSLTPSEKKVLLMK